ncbi:hypothetical protein [Bosea sp. (in: a-proteobacteria)]|jgi:hypothetical protein|uniref:hypothetical protein n=1 Tax=Bosea sp. (in: a-proteobacteria) TaxID=1871050 RepID=UPI003F6ED34E
MAMRMTSRDQDLVKWNNGSGFVSVKQVSEWMGVEFSTGARRVRALCEAGLLERREFPASTATVLIPTADGCALAGDNLPPLKGVRVATSRHDLLLVDCAMALEKRFDFRFEPERRLRARGFGATGHTPDGLLHRPSGRPVAVELELSQKSPARVTAIMDAYAATLDIEEVWYVVIDDVIDRYLRRLASGHEHIKVRKWRTAPGAQEASNG